MKAQKVISVMLMFSFLLNLCGVSIVAGKEREEMTIAVVDFANTKKDPGLDYLVKGIPESLITYLGKRGQVHIVERSRMEAALEEMKLGMSGIVDEQTAVEVGRAVGATAVMVGSFLQIGDRIRINTRLIEVVSSKIITAEQILGQVDEIFELMDQTAEAMWAKLADRPVKIQSIAIETKKPQVRKKAGTPLYKRWWFWGILAAAAGGAAYVASSQGGEEEEKGTLAITVQLP